MYEVRTQMIITKSYGLLSTLKFKLERVIKQKQELFNTNHYTYRIY